MAIISLIRHGQASFGSHNYDCLSPIGHRQGRVLGEHMGHLELAFDGCITGEMQRQRKTAEEAMAGLQGATPELQTDAAFNEYDSDGIFRAYMPTVLQADSQLAGMLGEDPRAMFRDKAVFQRAFVAVIDLWSGDAPHNTQLEPWADFLGRVRNGLDSLADRYPGKQQVAVFTSGGAISIAVGLALGLPPREALMLSWGIANASITELYASSSGLFINGFNNFTHLKLARDPALITYR